MPGAQTFVLILFLLGVGLLAFALVVALALVSRSWVRPGSLDPQAGNRLALGMSLGMLVGAALGIALWIITDEFVYWVVFVGAGMSVGIAIGSGLAARHR